GSVGPFPKAPPEPARGAPPADPDPGWGDSDAPPSEPVSKPTVGSTPGLADFVPADEPVEPEVLDDHPFFATLREAARDEPPLREAVRASAPRGPGDGEEDAALSVAETAPPTRGGGRRRCPPAASAGPLGLLEANRRGCAVDVEAGDTGIRRLTLRHLPVDGEHLVLDPLLVLPRGVRQRVAGPHLHADAVADVQTGRLAPVVELPGQLARGPPPPQIVVEGGVERDRVAAVLRQRPLGVRCRAHLDLVGTEVDGLTAGELEAVPAVLVERVLDCGAVHGAER